MMFKFEYTYSHEKDYKVIVTCSEDATLDEIGHIIEQFLKGCGYQFHRVEIVREDPNADK